MFRFGDLNITFCGLVMSGCWRSFLKFWGDVYIIGTFHQRLRSPSFWCPGCSWNGIALDQHLRRCGCTITMKWRAYIIHHWNIAVKTWPSTGTLATKVCLCCGLWEWFGQGHWYLSAPLLGCWRAGLVVDFPSELAPRHGSNCRGYILREWIRKTHQTHLHSFAVFSFNFHVFSRARFAWPKVWGLTWYSATLLKKKFSSSLAACFPSPSHHPRLVAAISTSPKLWLC